MQRGIPRVWFPAAVVLATSTWAGAGTLAPEGPAGASRASAPADVGPRPALRDHAATDAWRVVLGGGQPVCLADAVAGEFGTWGMAAGGGTPLLNDALAPGVIGPGSGPINAAIAHLGCGGGPAEGPSAFGGSWLEPDNPLSGEEAFRAEAEPDHSDPSPPRRMPLPIPGVAAGVGVLGIALRRRRW